jgi:hypothetical protein
VPHNLILAQESPVPLPYFQMAPDLKYNVLHVQERNPDILSFSLKKFRLANPLQFPQQGPYGDTRLQDIFTYLFISNALRAFLHDPQNRGSYGKIRHSRALVNISFRVPSKGAIRSSPHVVPSERDAPFLEPYFIHHSKTPVYEPPPDSRFLLDAKGHLWKDAYIWSLS